MLKVTITGNTITPKEILTREILDLIKGRIATIKKELLKTDNDLILFRKIYKLSDEEFLKKWGEGEMGDDQDYFIWESSIKMHDELKSEQKRLSELL
jgi:hypothetical protein